MTLTRHAKVRHLKLVRIARKHPVKFHTVHGGLQLCYHVCAFITEHGIMAYLAGGIAGMMIIAQYKGKSL